MDNNNRPILTELTELKIKLNEALRPASELDLRSLQVLVVSIALLALSLSTKKPDSIRFLGFLIDTDNWLYIAIPLVLILIYWVCELIVTWRLNRERVQYLIDGIVKEAKQLVDNFVHQCKKEMEASKEFTSRSAEIENKRRELWEWYESEWDKIQERRNNLPLEKYFGSEESKALDDEEEKLENEYQRRSEEGGINQLNRDADEYLSTLSMRVFKILCQ